MFVDLLADNAGDLPSLAAVRTSLAKGYVQPLVGTGYVAATMPATHAFSISELIFELSVATPYRLLMVGVEANEKIQAEPGRLAHYARRGALGAVYAQSLCDPESFAGDLVRDDLVQLVVNDHTSADADRIDVSATTAGLISPSAARAMTTTRPEAILRGEIVSVPTPTVRFVTTGNTVQRWIRWFKTRR